MEEKLKKLFTWIKKYKLRIVISLLFVYSFILIFKTNKNTDLTQKTSFTPKPNTSTRNNFYFNNDIPKYSDKNEVFLLNTFESPFKVNGFSWNKNKIVYSSSDGIYHLGNNLKLYDGKIQKSFFNKTGSNVLILEDNNFELLNLSNNSKKKINISPLNESIKTDDNLNHVLYIGSKDGLIHMHDLSTDIDNIIGNTNTNVYFDWIYNQNKFFIFNKELKIITIYDTDIQKIEQFSTNADKVISVSSDLSKIIAIDNNNLYVSNNDKSLLFSNPFKNTEDISLFWLDLDNFIVIEKRDLGYLGLYDQYIWVVNFNGDIKYLSNSEPITYKINTKTKPKVNEEKSAFALIDNNNQIWVYSLKPSVIPTYSDEGIYLYNVPNINREDNH